MTNIRRIAVAEGRKFQTLYVFRLDSLHQGLSAPYAVTGVAEHEESRDDEEGEHDSYKCVSLRFAGMPSHLRRRYAPRADLGLPHTLLYMAERID